MKKHPAILFEFMHKKIGALHKHFYVDDIRGQHGGDSLFYRVFLTGGICFSIFKKWENDEWVYSFFPEWPGTYNCTTATDVLAILTILGYNDEFYRL